MKQLINQFKKIQTFGCSLTAGDDIEDKSKIWPELLSKKLNCNLENFSYSNASNQSIADKVVEKCDKKSLVIVCWTGQFRHQIFHHATKIDYNILQYKDKKVIAQNEELHPMPKDLEKMISIQRKYVNEVQYYKNFLQTVLWLQHYLKAQKVAYLFCYGNSMSISFTNKLWNAKPQLANNLYDPKKLLKKFAFIKNIDKKYFLDFLNPHRSFWENCVAKNFHLGPTRHPLQDGHKFWANYLYKNVAKLFHN